MMDAKQLWPGRLVTSRVNILKLNRTLRFPALWGPPQDIPLGTIFKVGAVQLDERWVDLDAEHLVPMKRRFTFEEMGRLFDFA
jgi:hypothetical protein